MDKKQLNEMEENFCLIFTSGPSPYIGDAVRTYDLVFRSKSGEYGESDEKLATEENIKSSLAARKLLAREDIKDRIDELLSQNLVNATTLRPRLTSTLLKVIDECSNDVYEDKFGRKQSPAALRSVAVSAISKLTDMYGIKEDIAHKVMLEGKDGDGITFNLIVPEATKQGEDLIG